jgi:hypothetical protein
MWIAMFSTIAQDRDSDLLEHLEALARVDERDVLGRGDDDGARDGHLLRERELDVAGAGRQVDHEVVEVAPLGLAEQLLERLGHHRAAPDHRRVRLDEEAHAHRLDSVTLHRLHRSCRRATPDAR